ncbi:GTPase-activating Rap/Ran-GAP domain-like protein 3 [Triplophysa tibetana]|uniref:GTPase-activating Rap/Ran-GAP domain-like protein 3 n=1 Tax=Triplophysa tibetana TaxID=1572043 RepID=A0A5A9P924_9TELE|nr:GTPase-activating Rap/Ran-GAP domain-like protein 3 [Triplophysa tibetana]
MAIPAVMALNTFIPNKYDTFPFEDEEDPEDSEVLAKKFEEISLQWPAFFDRSRCPALNKITELDAQTAYPEPADLFYCESIEVLADRGEIFNLRSTSNTGKQLEVKIDTGAQCNVQPRGILQHTDPGAQPLINILKKTLHSPSARLQVMMHKLKRYNLNVINMQGKELYQADTLSLAHLPSSGWAETSKDYVVMTVKALSSRRIEELRQETQADYQCSHLSEHLMTDNAACFTSREFQEFARIWDFCHVTSTPHYPQSNGLTVSTVHSAKHLLEKCACDGTDVYVALLNRRNIPRDGLHSPVQCVLSRCTKTLIPMTKAMFVPKTRIRRRGKGHYDRLARPLTPIASRAYGEDADRGYDRVAKVTGRAPQPNSFQVQAGDTTYMSTGPDNIVFSVMFSHRKMSVHEKVCSGSLFVSRGGPAVDLIFPSLSLCALYRFSIRQTRSGAASSSSAVALLQSVYPCSQDPCALLSTTMNSDINMYLGRENAGIMRKRALLLRKGCSFEITRFKDAYLHIMFFASGRVTRKDSLPVITALESAQGKMDGAVWSSVRALFKIRAVCSQPQGHSRWGVSGVQVHDDNEHSSHVDVAWCVTSSDSERESRKIK